MKLKCPVMLTAKLLFVIAASFKFLNTKWVLHCCSPAGKYVFKLFNEGSEQVSWMLCWSHSKLITKTPEWHQTTSILALFVNFKRIQQNVQHINPANIYLFKVNNKNSRKWSHWRHSGVFNVKFEHISQPLLFLLLTLNRYLFV